MKERNFGLTVSDKELQSIMIMHENGKQAKHAAQKVFNQLLGVKVNTPDFMWLQYTSEIEELDCELVKQLSITHDSAVILMHQCFQKLFPTLEPLVCYAIEHDFVGHHDLLDELYTAGVDGLKYGMLHYDVENPKVGSFFYKCVVDHMQAVIEMHHASKRPNGIAV